MKANSKKGLFIIYLLFNYFRTILFIYYLLIFMHSFRYLTHCPLSHVLGRHHGGGSIQYVADTEAENKGGIGTRYKLQRHPIQLTSPSYMDSSKVFRASQSSTMCLKPSSQHMSPRSGVSNTDHKTTLQHLNFIGRSHKGF